MVVNLLIMLTTLIRISVISITHDTINNNNNNSNALCTSTHDSRLAPVLLPERPLLGRRKVAVGLALPLLLLLLLLLQLLLTNALMLVVC